MEELSGVTGVTVDDAGTAWFLTEGDEGDRLVAVAVDGTERSLHLGRTGGSSSFGVQLFPGGGGVVVARVLCSDADCTRSVLDAADHVIVDDKIERREWPGEDPALRNPGGVNLVGPVDGSFAVESDSVVRWGENSVRLPENFSDPCFVGGTLVAVEYDFNLDANTASTLPAPESELPGHIHRFDGVRWSPVEGSEFSYTTGSGLELRCGTAGLEMAPDTGTAVRVWEGDGPWRDIGKPRELRWLYGPVLDHAGLLGVLNGPVVARVDSLTGETLSEVLPGEDLARQWTRTDVPPNGLLGLGVGPDAVAAVCAAFDEPGAGGPTRCVTFS